MWGTDDVIVYATRDGLWRVSAAGGGVPERLTPESDGADLYSMPRLLPGGMPSCSLAEGEFRMWK